MMDFKRIRQLSTIRPLVFPAINFKGNRWLAIPTCITARASHTCRDACRDRSPPPMERKHSRYSRCMRNPQFYISGNIVWPRWMTSFVAYAKQPLYTRFTWCYVLQCICTTHMRNVASAIECTHWRSLYLLYREVEMSVWRGFRQRFIYTDLPTLYLSTYTWCLPSNLCHLSNCSNNQITIYIIKSLCRYWANISSIIILKYCMTHMRFTHFMWVFHHYHQYHYNYYYHYH